MKGNSTEGGGAAGSRREKTAANVEVAWHFYACREPCVASASAGDREWWRDSNWNRGGRVDLTLWRIVYTPKRGLISLALPFSHICSSRHLLELQSGKTWQRGSHFSRLEGSDSERGCAHYVLAAGSCSVWTMSRRPVLPGRVKSRDSEWNMEHGCGESVQTGNIFLLTKTGWPPRLRRPSTWRNVGRSRCTWTLMFSI